MLFFDLILYQNIIKGLGTHIKNIDLHSLPDRTPKHFLKCCSDPVSFFL